MTLVENLSAAFLLGLILGFVNSIPIGPITLSIVHTTLRRGFVPGLAVGLGALTVYTAYCVIGTFSMAALHTTLMEWMRWFASPVMIILGLRLIHQGTKNAPSGSAAPSSGQALGTGFSSGFLILLANPMAMGFWIMAASTLFAWNWLSTGFADKVVFVLGMTLGTLAWFLLLARFVDRQRRVLANRTVGRISIVAGIILLILAAGTAMKALQR